MPNPGVAALRLKAWKGATVTVADHVKGVIPTKDRKRDVPFAGQTGVVVALNTCLPSCGRPDLHDELAVQIRSKLYWFRASELVREPGLIGSESPRSPAKAESGTQERTA